jgi:hypothetical protein
MQIVRRDSGYDFSAERARSFFANLYQPRGFSPRIMVLTNNSRNSNDPRAKAARLINPLENIVRYRTRSFTMRRL